jgi:hypothetical protein
MNIHQTTESLLELSDMTQHCVETSDNVLLKMNLGELNQSVADFFRICADEICKYKTPEQSDENEDTPDQEETASKKYLYVNDKNGGEKISLGNLSEIFSQDVEAENNFPEIVAQENTEIEGGNIFCEDPGE